MKKTIVLFIALFAFPVWAAPVPQEETDEAATARIAAAKAAHSIEMAAPGAKILTDDEGHVVIRIDAGSGPEPITRLIRLTHSAVLWRVAHGPVVKSWLINWLWDGILFGPQFVQKGVLTHPLDKMTSEAWLANMTYNSSSENGLIELARWCRRGGASQVVNICSHVRSSAIERMVWDRAGRP